MTFPASIHPELILVGAGPGDPDLITVKALKALQSADVVLYDNLVNEALLSLAPAGCECIYVGKLPYGDYTPQEVIHELIREKAFTRGKVIRLKGGDPFIFGRGFEELLFAEEAGIPASYIPGITSMQAVGLHGIPLTHRQVSESIWVVTGTKRDGSLSADLRLAMQSKATVVIYMGMKKLAEIAQAYTDNGMGQMPAVILQHASQDRKKIARGRAGDLVAMAARQEISHPAIIILGPVADLKNYLLQYGVTGESGLKKAI